MQLILESSAITNECARAVLDGLPPVMWYIRCRIRRQKGKGLSVPQYRALFFIDAYKTASLSMICDHMGCALPTTSRLISGLVRKKLLSRQRSIEDARLKEVKLTAEGKKSLALTSKQTRSGLAEVLQELSPKDQQIVCESMTVLKKVFSKKTLSGK